KQASLFLRNIGYATHVAILDIHVLTYMHWMGLTETIMTSIPALPKYESLERTFIGHVYSLGYTPDCFDLAVWVVMRVAKEGQRTWE
ncbi:8-oxoguanine DNA glycosylase, partial [Pelomicrobium sp. G1]|uniref:8-oxoguanine DNA glycosylase n=1 Tax=Pelomicrobium sp. G1 TaxID=3452920 RepID=UPI003F7583E6